MKQIFKLLSKYSGFIFFVIIFLYLQAICNLELPGYTAKIVDTGISNYGIEETIPKKITKDDFNNLLLVSKEDEKIKDAYTEEDNLYILKDLEKNEIKDLEDIINSPMIIISVLSSEEFSKDIAKEMPLVDNDIFKTLSLMNEEQLNMFIDTFNEKISKLDSSITNGMKISYIKTVYENANVNIKNKQINYIIISGLKMLAISVAALVLTVVTTYLSSKIGSSFGKELRSKVVNKIMSFSTHEFEQISIASLITRSTNDVQQVQNLIIMGLRVIILAPIMGIGALLKISNNSMSWVIGVAILAITLLIVVLFTLALPKFQVVQKMIDKLTSVTREILTGLPVIRAFANYKHEEKRFDKANDDLAKVNRFVDRVMSFMFPSMMFIMNGISILIIWVGADKINNGVIEVGTMMAFITYTMQIIMAFLILTMMSIMIPRSFVSMKRIAEILNKKISVVDKEKTTKLKNKHIETIEFKDVYFKYPDAVEDVLSNISFKVKKGTTVSFIGSTGSGKSTLINLLPRFYDVTSGKILIDGVDLRDLKLSDFRSRIGYVPQKGMLFSGTIESNILFGKNKNKDVNLKEVAKISQALEFIEKKEEKFKSSISQSGKNISGGQKQRLSIARALARNAEIYIFDDCFSALDFRTEAKLRSELKKRLKNKFIFIVAQRISTVIDSDVIVVLDKGEIVGIGKHKELLKNCDVYRDIALSQLSKEELNYE